MKDRSNHQVHNNNFDLVRLFAAAQVAIVHICEHLQMPKSLALQILEFFPGVPIFFFVSGFLVSQSLERSQSLASYFRKRCLRIYPALLVCLAFSIALAASFKSLPWMSGEFMAWLVAQMTIAQFFNPTFLRDFGVGVLNGSLWTIPVELQFYLALPFIYAFGRMMGIRFFWYVTIVALILHTVFLAMIYGTGTMAAKLAQVTVLPWLGFFMVGVLAQQYWAVISGLFCGKLILWLVAYCTIAILIYFVAPDYATGNRINTISGLALFGVVLSAAYTVPNLSHLLLGGNDISYGLYLYHAPFINAVLELQESGSLEIGAIPSAVLIFFMSIATAVTSWRLVERPALALKHGRKNQTVISPRTGIGA